MQSNQFLYGYPICELVLIKEGKKEKISCIIDTGSPYTLIPLYSINKPGIKEDEQFTQVTIHGVIHKEECSVDVPGYEIDLSIGDLSFPRSTVFCYEFLEKYGLIGHNLLIHCKLLVDWKHKKKLI